jgi:type VII secretion integral membrane protein EccD
VTPIESRSFCRVVVIAATVRVDLALPADVAIIDLLPMLLQYAGQPGDDGGGMHGGWKLVRVGHGELDGGRTLRSLDVVDGEVLRLTAREERSVVPVFDDIVDVVAAARRDCINTRSSNPGMGAGVVVATMLVAAMTLLYRDRNVADAYLAGGAALLLLGLATAVARGSGDRMTATATAAAGIAFAVVCGLNAVPGQFGRWGVLLGAAAALVYSLAAVLSLGTGVVVFAGSSTAALLTGSSALVAGLTNAAPLRVVAGTIAVALAALSMLPRLAVRLARLPLATVPTTNEDLTAADEMGDIGDLTTRARLAGEYLTGTQFGCAATIGGAAVVLGVHASIMSIALAGTAAVAMALRARSVAGLSGRIALVGAAAASGLIAAAVLVITRKDGDGSGLLVVELAVGALALVLSGASSRRRPSPQTMRLVDFVESAVVVAVLPLAVGVMGLYAVVRQR